MNESDYQFYEENPEADIFSYLTHIPKYCTWNDIKGLDRSFLENPENRSAIQSAFVDKVNDNKYSIVRNEVTGELFFPMVPYRGNPAYARKKHKRIQPIIDAYRNKEFSKSVNGSRSSEIRMVYAIMVTLSFARSNSTAVTTSHGFPVKPWGSWEAWEALKGSNSIINQFKVELSRAIGSTYGACTVKEGCKDDYPAPHMVVIFDKPVIAHRWGKQWLLGKPNDRSLVDEIQSSWERIAGSHCKVNAIIDAKGFAYVFKYIQKSVNTNVSSIDDMTESELVCLNTHLNHALHDLNDVISPAFLRKLDYTRELNLLDITRNKLKQTIKERDRLINEIEQKGGLNPFTLAFYPELSRYYILEEDILRLRREVFEVKMATSPWFFIKGGFSSLESALIDARCEYSFVSNEN